VDLIIGKKGHCEKEGKPGGKSKSGKGRFGTEKPGIFRWREDSVARVREDGKNLGGGELWERKS